MNTKRRKSLPGWLPYAIGALLVVQFAALGVWQISRGLEKQASRDAFENRSSFTTFHNGMDVRSYQALEVDGRFLADTQFLLDNIILNSRYGYYVVTALETSEDEPLLLVNRGWLQKSGPIADIDAVAGTIGVTDERLRVRGRVGSLPRPGIRVGDAIEARDDWPKVAIWPTADDIAAVLGRDVQPFLLLMDPDDPNGFVRHWVPEEMGPGKHYGYALQWFAMGAVLAGLLIWNWRKRRSGSGESL